MKPPLLYFGAKGRIADQIVSHFPPHTGYIEPYAGSLSVLLTKRPSQIETVNDKDEQLMTFWRMLRDRPDDLATACALTPHSAAELDWCINAPLSDDPVETARRVWVRLTQGRAAQLRRATGWRYFSDPNGTHSSMRASLDAYLTRFGPAIARLREVTLDCRDALEVITDYGRHADNLLYVDPPYPGSVRSWGNNYRHEMREDDEHRALAAALRPARAAVVLSGYACDLYDGELYPDWYRVEIAAQTGNSDKPERTEVLWSNRPLSNQLTFDFAVTAVGGVR